MNIVVIGSCTDSSNLAKELNKRLPNSIVARIDALKAIKQVFLDPLKIRTTENLGTYVGDVEMYKISEIPETLLTKISTSITTAVETASELKEDKKVNQVSISTFDALTNSFPTGTYSFVKVYSGFNTDKEICNLVADENFIGNSIIVKLEKATNPIIPIKVSEETISLLKEKSFSFLECESVDKVFTTTLFEMLFEETKPAKTITLASSNTVSVAA